MQYRFAIISYHNDLHALGAQALLRRWGDDCAIIASDRLVASDALSWSLAADGAPATVRDVDGEEVAVGGLDALWWRRHVRTPRLDPATLAMAGREFAANNTRAALLGVLLTEFRGVWLDHPEAIRRAENKLLQLRVAQAAGLRIPATLVSQDPERIRAFHDRHEGQVVVKGTAGMFGVPALTGELTPPMLDDPDPLTLCPAIYQELIPGRRHLRVHCFGDHVRAAVIESERLDWRHPLDVEMEPFSLSPDLHRRLQEVLTELDLRMGVFDLKLAEDGEPWWLELNPQGQFLFVEALGGGDLLEPFVRFLRKEAEGGRAESSTASGDGVRSRILGRS